LAAAAPIASLLRPANPFQELQAQLSEKEGAARIACSLRAFLPFGLIMADSESLAACALCAPVTDSLLLSRCQPPPPPPSAPRLSVLVPPADTISSSSVYASVCGNGLRIATLASSTAMFIQGLGSSVQCIAHHHDKGLLAYCEGFSGTSPPRIFVLQFNDQLLSSSNLTCVAVLQARALDDSLVALAFSHDGSHIIALTAVGSSSVVVWHIASGAVVAAADFEGLQTKIAVLPSASALMFATFGASGADIWRVDAGADGSHSAINQRVDVTLLDDGDCMTCAAWLSRCCSYFTRTLTFCNTFTRTLTFCNTSSGTAS
jgi:hypothetical protein